MSSSLRARATFSCAATALVALVLGACGGGTGRSGGTMTILGTDFPDALDPALSYGVEGWQPLSQAYPGLLTFRHASGRAGTQLQPGLAQALPRISADGRTYRFRLRRNLNFSNGRPLRASDFKHSFERIIALDSPGAPLGYLDVVGADQYAKTKKGGISGIAVNDATGDITLHLVKPHGTFSYALALPFGGVVPASTPASNQTAAPPPGAGRYVIGQVRPGRSFVLTKNPRFSPGLRGTPVDVGKLDRITEVINSNVSAQVTQVERNQADFMVQNPAAGRAGEVRRRYAGTRYREFPTTSTYYFFMNSSVAPFDKPAVRQAVNYALDFSALNRLQEGFLEPQHTILPKLIPGYEPSSDLYPAPNLQRARQLIAQAGAKGAAVTVWGYPGDPVAATMAYYTDLLNKLGLKAKLKTLPSPDAYGQAIGDPSLHAQTGYANFTADYPHPADFIETLLNPDNISPVNNQNYSMNTADKAYAQQINALAAQQLTPKTEREWAALDRHAQEQAYWGVYATRKQSTFFSTRMDFKNCKGDDWPLAAHDWARFCLK